MLEIRFENTVLIEGEPALSIIPMNAMAANTMVPIAGVRNFGLIVPKSFGKTLSRDIDNAILAEGKRVVCVVATVEVNTATIMTNPAHDPKSWPPKKKRISPELFAICFGLRSYSSLL